MMETILLNDGIIAENFTGIGNVTRKMVRERATELALIDGRAAQDVSKTDWEQAKRELTGKRDGDPNEMLHEQIPPSLDADMAPGSAGDRVPEIPVEGEDGDGRSVGEKLVEQGLNEAEHDLMLQAARKAE